ncbi:MAG: hypothetical protein KF901_11595 [Myxococcales bacterium]|nr:hypothetical protein [Myxococcales bacterium]
MPHEATGPLLASNAERSDYAGSASCQRCHEAIHAAWSASPMHQMTREMGARIRAPFGEEPFRFGDALVSAERHGERHYLRVRRPGEERLWRLTRVIGGRYREDYAGVIAGGTEPGAREGTTEVILPLSWVFDPGEWRYKGYSVMVRERPPHALTTARAKWTETCSFCHNTVPLLSTLYDELSTARIAYQGSTPSNLLPAARQQRFGVPDDRALARAVGAELAFLGARPPPAGDLDAVLAHAARETRRRFDAGHLVELGIGCEACHHGSRAHVDDPRILPSYDVVSPFVETRPVPGQREVGHVEAQNRTCARCHSVLFSRYRPTWEGGDRRGEAGGSHVNSGEARDFLLGGCALSMSCTTCHDPHGVDDPARLAAFATPAANGTCTSCHEAYASPEGLRAHAHHDPEGEAGSCVACHMPRKNLGLGYGLTRYHRIGSPTDAERVENDRPLECALCHADRSVATLVDDMERLWGKRYDRARLAALYGARAARTPRAGAELPLDLDAAALTLTRGQPHEQATAMALLGERGDERAVPLLVDQLDHPYPLLRYVAREALTTILGERPPIDLSQPGDAAEQQARAWLLTR